MTDPTPLATEALILKASDRLQALAQPTRLRLVELLSRGEGTPQELSDALGLTQQNVSKHLLTLHRAGLASRRREGANVFYALHDQTPTTILCLAITSAQREFRALAHLAEAPRPDGIDRTSR
jgi:DNA-binding transcriptional ArsR family regulator